MSHNLRTRQIWYFQILTVRKQEPVLSVDDPDHLLRTFHRFLVLSQTAFRQLALGHIHIDPEHSYRLSRFIPENLPVPGNPVDTAVRPDHTPFSLGRLPGFEAAAPKVIDSVPILRMNQLVEKSRRCCSIKFTGRQAVHELKFC